MYGSASENFYSEGNSRGNQLRMVELVFCSLIQIFRLVHLKSNPKSWVFSPGQAYFLIFEVLIHPWIFHFKIMREARVILVPPWEDESILRHGRFFDYMKIQTFVTQSNFFCFLLETDHQPRLDAWDKHSDLVHWEDLEGAGGEGGGRWDRDGDTVKFYWLVGKEVVNWLVYLSA